MSEDTTIVICGDPDYVNNVWVATLDELGWSRKRRKKWLRRQGFELNRVNEDARWEREFYNSYGNYTGFRFQDWCARCPHLEQTGTYWHCHHPDRKSEGKYVHCELHVCPCVEIDGDEGEYLGWSDCETPVLVKAQSQ